MNENLTRYFPDGVEIGQGVACGESPFSATLIFDFYDGPTEGVSKISGTGSAVYFKKLWWGQRQDNRLFDGTIFSLDELRACNEKLADRVENGFKSGLDSPAADVSQPEELINAVRTLESTVQVNILCRNITRELFILPATND